MELYKFTSPAKIYIRDAKFYIPRLSKNLKVEILCEIQNSLLISKFVAIKIRHTIKLTHILGSSYNGRQK